jgi:hypothetical protein
LPVTGLHLPRTGDARPAQAEHLKEILAERRDGKFRWIVTFRWPKTCAD